MASRTPHIVGGGLGTLRAQDAQKWKTRQAANNAVMNAAIMRSIGESKRGVSLVKH